MAFGQRKIVTRLTNTGDGSMIGISGFDTRSANEGRSSSVDPNF